VDRDRRGRSRAGERGGDLMTSSLVTRRRHTEPEPYSFGSRPYDLVKEFTIALVVVLGLTFALAAVFSSPDEKPTTIASWAKADPGDFTATALSELDASSATAGYGPPYNTAADGQKLGPLALAKFAGVTHPIDTAQAFVLGPLAAAPQDARSARRWVSTRRRARTSRTSGPTPTPTR